jgi:hypothetical protein
MITDKFEVHKRSYLGNSRRRQCCGRYHDYAQDLLGEVLFLMMPPSEGDSFAKGEVFAEVESEKHLPN